MDGAQEEYKMESASSSQAKSKMGVTTRIVFAVCCFLLVSVIICAESVRRHSLEVGRRKLASTEKLAAVNLGGWLNIEGWIKPSLFDGIHESDLLDGSQIQLKSTTLNTYVCAEGGGGEEVVVNRQAASGWETFKIWRHTASVYSLRVSNNKFISALNAGGGNVTATGATPREWEYLTFTRNPNNKSLVHIKAYNGMYLQAKDENQLTADYVSESEPEWGNNAATFEMTIYSSSPFRGEYQLANGWGDLAESVFKEHRDTFVTEADFEYLRSVGINAVRIPVGYWIASDPNPPKPFIAGSLQCLDNAFDWAEANNIKIIVDLHAAPGSQNGQEHSATVDGVAEWATGSNPSGTSYIDQTVDVIDFLAQRYTSRSALYGIELLNEPQASVVPLDILKSYYRQGYKAVRKYSADTYVVMCQLLSADASAFLDLGTEFTNAIIDLHYYNVFGSTFSSMTLQENIDYINNQRKQEIEKLNQNGNGLLTFIGEWTNEFGIQGVSQSGYQTFGETQLQVYAEATAGWAYWNYIIDQSGYLHWDFKRSYQNQYLVKPTNGWIS